MAAFNGCEGTIYDAAGPTELLGISMWKFSESVKNEDYADNTTGCSTKTNIGPKTTTVDIDVNLQDGAGKGLPPLVTGNEYDLQLHIDATGNNYFEGSVVVLEMTDYEVNIAEGSLVSASYSCKVQGELTGQGTLSSFNS